VPSGIAREAPASGRRQAGDRAKPLFGKPLACPGGVGQRPTGLGLWPQGRGFPSFFERIGQKPYFGDF